MQVIAMLRELSVFPLKSKCKVDASLCQLVCTLLKHYSILHAKNNSKNFVWLNHIYKWLNFIRFGTRIVWVRTESNYYPLSPRWRPCIFVVICLRACSYGLKLYVVVRCVRLNNGQMSLAVH